MGSNAMTTLAMIWSTLRARFRCGEVRISMGWAMGYWLASRLMDLAMRKYWVSGMFDGQT